MDKSRKHIEEPPPHNIEAERGVLGACMLNPDAIYLARHILPTPAAFFLVAHQLIYAGMLALVDSQRPIDAVTLTSQLGDRILDSGGCSYLADLCTAVPTSANVEFYAEIVANSSLSRELTQTFAMLSAEARKIEEPRVFAVDALERLERMLSEVSGNSSVSPKDDKAKEAIDHFLNRLHGDAPMGMTTGIHEIDAKLHYGLSDEIAIVAGRPSVGKTALMLTVAEHVARRYGPVYVGSTESSAEKLVQRLSAIVCPHDKFILACRNGRQERANLMRRYLCELERRPIWINDHAPYIEDMVSAIRAHCLRVPETKMVFLDYLQRFDSRRRFRGETEAINYIMRQIAFLRDRIRRPIVVLSQLSRVEFKEEWGPGLSNLKQSGNIEQDADVVLLLWIKEHEDHEQNAYTVNVQARLAKQRDGPTGIIRGGLQLIRPQTLFISPEHGRNLDDAQLEFSGDDDTPF